MIRVSAFFVVLSFASFFGTATFALENTLEIQSRTLSDEDFLKGNQKAGIPVVLKGVLSGPDDKGKLTVVILLHGTDGPGSGAVWGWSRFLNSIGIATLSLDSYTARGLTQASTDQSQFGQFTQIYDAYRAADALAEHPDIDASRVALMGFSRGGNTALYSAMIRFQRSFGPSRAQIVAHLPFYPACNFQLVDELKVAAVPIREFHGADDDWTPPAPCRSYIERLAKAGNDATMTEYDGALHGFDSPRNPARFADPDNQTSRNCWRKEEDGKLLNAATGRPFSYADTCVEYGPSSQYNDTATTAAQAAVKVILSEVFGRK
ncbi:dienelactone hydrolase family protein [Phyllobacterium bourgognense]|uniref:Dienelactone hydrolase n=1 Tax=Phyllobacterium bourgognense TaxID=314236 RepID=A0A368Z3Z1_9HYPH|nr:alpha/beta hydrolase fold domain-containing protein [Phyllobacterium bourgognense]RCW85164.1 dienelactone hydrolase [Phyllobacterium bourgognense]